MSLMVIVNVESSVVSRAGILVNVFGGYMGSVVSRAGVLNNAASGDT